MLGAGEEYQGELGVKMILKAKSGYEATQEIGQVGDTKLRRHSLQLPMENSSFG